MLIGEHNSLRAPPGGRTDVPGGVDAGDVRGVADITHSATKECLRGAEGESVANAADPDRILPAVEEEHARTARATDDKARLDDVEADAAAVGVCVGHESRPGHGQQRNQTCTKGG